MTLWPPACDLHLVTSSSWPCDLQLVTSSLWPPAFDLVTFSSEIRAAFLTGLNQLETWTEGGDMLLCCVAMETRRYGYTSLSSVAMETCSLQHRDAALLWRRDALFPVVASRDALERHQRPQRLTLKYITFTHLQCHREVTRPRRGEAPGSSSWFMSRIKGADFHLQHHNFCL